MSHQNIWEHLLKTLESCSNRFIFGIFGDAINPLADALRKDKQKRFKWIGVRHEEVGAFAASAQAKITNKLGLCAGTVGPGAIHLLNGLYDAKMDHAPVLALTGQIPREELGSDYHQEVNLDRLFEDVCCYNQTAVVPEQIPRLGLLAAQTALAKQGVAHLSIPSDIGPSSSTTASLDHLVFQVHDTLLPCESDLKQLANQLNQSDHMVILAGWGARHASHQVIALAEKLKAPIIHTLKGKAVIPETHAYWAGGIGMIGSRSGMDALNDCDTLLMLGTDFPYRQFYPKNKTIIQIDTAAERLGKRCAVTIGLVADTRSLINTLLPMIHNKKSDVFLKSIQKKRDKWLASIENRGKTIKPATSIRPQQLAYWIDQYAKEDALFTVDTGETIVWMARHIQMKGERDFIASFNHASMANAFAHAIGLQALNRDRQVIALCGDGGFTMLMGDFITAVTYQLPIKTFIFNNQQLGLVRMEMESSGYPQWGVQLDNPNLADCATAMGGTGIRVAEVQALKPAIQRALSTDGPVLVDVLTNPGEIIFPPKITPAQAFGFSISKMKELWIEKK